MAFNETGWAEEHFGASADNALMLCRLHAYSPSDKMGFVGTGYRDSSAYEVGVPVNRKHRGAAVLSKAHMLLAVRAAIR